MAIILSAPAEQDLESILSYTLEEWGKIQFDSYYHLIQATLAEIDSDPNCLICRPCEDLFKSCYSKTFGRHIVFYRFIDPQVEIVRILHQMMDHQAYFQSPPPPTQ